MIIFFQSLVQQAEHCLRGHIIFLAENYKFIPTYPIYLTDIRKHGIQEVGSTAYNGISGMMTVGIIGML